MISNLKESLIKTIDEIEKKEKERYTLFDEIDELQIKENELVAERKSSKGILKSLINRRKIDRINSQINNIIDAIVEKGQLQSKIYDKIQELKVKNMINSIPGKTLTDKKESISKAKFLDDLYISFEQAKNILENNGYEFILDESDKNIVKGVNRHNVGTKEIAFVRLTDSMPKNNKILRKIDENVMDIVKGGFGEIKIPASRETLHFSACSEVADTGFTTWTNKKIAIIIPLKGFPKDMKVTSYSPADFQVKDSVSIPESGWIICPKSEFENVTKNNLGCHIIPYDGDNVSGFANTLLTYLGYDYHSLSEHNFVDNDSISYDSKIEEHFNLSKIKKIQHSSTIEHKEESIGKVRNLFIAFREAIKNGEIKYNEETKSEVHTIIKKEFDSFAKIDLYEKLGLLKELSINKKDIELTESADLISFLMEKIIEALDKEKEEFDRKHRIKENGKDDQIVENAEKQQETNDKSNATDNLKDSYEEERVEPTDLKKAQKQVEATINQEQNQPIKQGEENDEH